MYIKKDYSQELMGGKISNRSLQWVISNNIDYKRKERKVKNDMGSYCFDNLVFSW